MNPISGLSKLIYWPICRSYARHLGDRPADVLFRYLCALQFWLTYHSCPNFLQPTRFSSKVWHRMLYDRNPLLTEISDKLRVRDYVAEKVGRKYLIPLLWSGDKPEELPFDNLPLKFVIKTNHGCGYNIIVKNKTQLNRESTKKILKKWLAENFCQDTYLGIAWAYKNIKPQIIVESFIEENGQIPLDYKLFCFSGRMEYFKIDFDRFEDHAAKYFNKELKALDLVEVGFKQYLGRIDLPSNFDEMIRLAESLAKGFDFIRVDLYNINNNIYFGELTPYPGGISQKLDPDNYDYILGKKWKL